MVKELSDNKSKTSKKQYKETYSKDKNPKDKYDPYKKDSDSKSSKESSKVELTHSHSNTYKSKRSRSRSYSKDKPTIKTKNTYTIPTNKTNNTEVVDKKVVKKQIDPKNSSEIKSKESNLQSEPQSTTATSSTSESTKDNKEQNYWKDFPVPKFYKDLEKFYDPIPKFGVLTPSMYFPYDGPKLRRYKNYRFYKDPLSKYNDEEQYGKELKELIFQDLQIFKRKLELFQLEIDMASLKPNTI